jgi:hypothetical protein
VYTTEAIGSSSQTLQEDGMEGHIMKRVMIEMISLSLSQGLGSRYTVLNDLRESSYTASKGNEADGRYGYYYVEVDGENRRFFNAHSTTDEIPALLFEATNLGDHDHSVWFMNQQNYGTQRSRSCESHFYTIEGVLRNQVSVSTTSSSSNHSKSKNPSFPCLYSDNP